MNKFFLLLTFGLSFLPSANGEDRPEALNRYLENLNSLQADFRQKLFSELGEELETSTGIVYMQRPGKFRWNYQEPYSQLIITDGQTLWLYDEDLEQVTIKDISDSIEDSPAAILSGDGEFDEHFLVVDMGSIEGYEWIELTPRDIENQYKSIRLGFNDENIGMMILSDNLGQVTRIDFSGAERNIRLDDNLFTFDPPDDVDVIDEREAITIQ